MSDKKDGKDGLRVVIVGGSVAGLTFAHCLAKNGIDYVLLERNSDIAPEVGASIGILGNGARILDQLGCWDDIEASSSPLKTGTNWTATGEMIMSSDYPQLQDARNGYPVCFLERQRVLEILYNHLPDRDTRVFTSKKVTQIEHLESGVVVHCEDGSNYSGDIVAGADGVHSFVRGEMQTYATLTGPLGAMDNDMKSMTSEYYAAFGISSPTSGFIPGECYRTYSKDISTLTICGQDDKVFWFLFKKHAKRYPRGHIPRFSRDDIATELDPHMGFMITDTVDFGAVWKNRVSYTMVSLEESNNENWTWDRFVCLGDSICKMTPNMGQGGNNAIESAAALANNLARVEDSSFASIKKALLSYQNDRRERANAVAVLANDLTRLEAMSDWKKKLLGLYITPVLKDYLSDKASSTIMGAEYLEAVPLPKRSLNANMIWDRGTGIGRSEPLWRRALYGLPILGFAFLGTRTMSVVAKQFYPMIGAGLQSGTLDVGKGMVAAVGTKFLGIPALDALVRPFVAVFSPSIGWFDTEHALQTMTFMWDLFPVYTIWTVESLRRGNVFTVSQLAVPIGLFSQLKGIGLTAPVYYFLHYIQSPQEKYAAADNRMVPAPYARALLPAVAAVYLPLTYLMFDRSLPLLSRQNINAIWQFFPLLTAVAHRALAARLPDTETADRLYNPRADMPYLRAAYAVSSTVSFAGYAYAALTSPVSLTKLFFGGIAQPGKAVADLTTGLARFMKYDYLLSSGAGYAWVLLNFWDLKRTGKFRDGWGKVLSAMGLSTLFGGPGTTMGLMWWWREEILAKKPLEIHNEREEA